MNLLFTMEMVLDLKVKLIMNFNKLLFPELEVIDGTREQCSWVPLTRHRTLDFSLAHHPPTTRLRVKLFAHAHARSLPAGL